MKLKILKGGPAGDVGGKSLEKSGKLLCIKIISMRVTRARKLFEREKNLLNNTRRKLRKKTDNSCVEKPPISVSTSDRGHAEPCQEGRRGRLLCVK